MTTAHQNGVTGDAKAHLGDAEEPLGDAAGGAAVRGAAVEAPSISVPEVASSVRPASPGRADKPAKPHGAAENGDAGAAGDAVSSLPKYEGEKEDQSGDRASIESKGGRASPPPPASPGKAEKKKASKDAKDEKDEKLKLAEEVITCVQTQADLFHDDKGDAYATVFAHGVERTMRLDSGAFRAWVARTIREEIGHSVGTSTIDEARLALQGIALYDSPEKHVHVRVAEHQGVLYLDLGDDTGACVECKPDGWAIVDRAPDEVKLIRPSGLRPLPRPVKGGSVEELRPFVNVPDESFCLLLGWLVAAFRPGRPFTIAAIVGEQGTAKTSAAKVLRRCIDPSVADVRSPPRCEDDLMVMAHNSHVVCVDNLSGLPPWLSDGFCRIATGGGLSKRAHYENADEVIVEALRPAILNGIDDIANRADLAERCIVFVLEPIEKTKRRDEESFWAAFDEAAPRILGALLEAVCGALAGVKKVKIRDLPRMADFAKWTAAAEPALGLKRRSMLAAYRKNLKGASAVALEASPVAGAVRDFVRKKGTWAGTAESLLAALSRGATLAITTSRAWPKDGTRLSGRLRRDAVPLREAGIEIEFTTHGRGKRKRRWIKLKDAAAGDAQ